MKKLVSFLLATFMLLTCVIVSPACDNNNNSSSAQTNCIHSYSITERQATCTKGGYATYKCSLCYNIYSEYENALGHTTDCGTCSRCGQIFEAEVWAISFYVDEFYNQTDEAYMSNKDVFVGTFSNSATTNSKLYVRILIDVEDVAIKLWEYGSQEVKAYATTHYNITLLDDKGNKHYTTGTMYKNGARIYLEDWIFVNLLQENEKLEVYIMEDEKYGYRSTYLFEVKNENFNDIYSNFYYQYID